MVFKLSQQPVEIESSFTSLNSCGNLKMKDARLFAKQLLESSADPEENFKNFNSSLPLDSKLGHHYSEIYQQFLQGNLDAYNHNFAWYHIIHKMVKLKQVQTLPTKPVPFKLEKLFIQLKLQEQFHNQMEKSRFEKQMAQFKLMKQEESSRSFSDSDSDEDSPRVKPVADF